MVLVRYLPGSSEVKCEPDKYLLAQQHLRYSIIPVICVEGAILCYLRWIYWLGSSMTNREPMQYRPVSAKGCSYQLFDKDWTALVLAEYSSVL